MMEWKDYLGVPLKVGDFVLGAGRYDFNKGVVTGFTPTMVRTSCGTYNPENLVSAQAVFQLAGKEKWMQSEFDQNKDRLTSKVEAVKISWRYMIALVQDRDTNAWYGTVMKLNGSSMGLFRESHGEWLKERDLFDGNKAYYLKQMASGYLHGSYKTRYVEGFDTGYSWYGDKGETLTTVKGHGLAELVNILMPIDEFITKFPKWNLARLRAEGKI